MESHLCSTIAITSRVLAELLGTPYRETNTNDEYYISPATEIYSNTPGSRCYHSTTSRSSNFLQAKSCYMASRARSNSRHCTHHPGESDRALSDGRWWSRLKGRRRQLRTPQWREEPWGWMWQRSALFLGGEVSYYARVVEIAVAVA